jgi:hypothetical protein
MTTFGQAADSKPIESINSPKVAQGQEPAIFAGPCPTSLIKTNFEGYL